MNYEFKYMEDKGIVSITTSGSYELAAEIETVKEIKSQLKKYQSGRCLIDHRAATLILGTMDSYDRPQLYASLGFKRHMKVAIVFKEINDDFRFYETVCRNRGWNVKISENYDAAVDWLDE